MRGKTIFFVGLAALACTAQAAHAQAPAGSEASAGIERRGFLIGFSLGAGSIVPDCDGCDGVNGGAVNIQLGGMLSPRLGLMFDGYAVVHPEGGYTLTNSVDTVALQYWVGTAAWVKGGLGFGQLSVDDENGETVLASKTGTALLLAGGFELLQTHTFALDAQLRIGTVSYDNGTISNVSLGLGFNWY